MKGSNPDGFSLLEVMAAAGIGMILSATIIPNMVNGISTMQMRSNMTSLAGVVRNLNAQLPESQHIRPAQVLRVTVEKNNGSWDPPGADGILGDWVNLVLGDPETSPHTAIGKGAKLWVLRP